MEKAYLNIELSEDGNIKIDTNLSSLGAVHVMSDAQKVIIQNIITAQDNEVQAENAPEDESEED